MSQDGTYQLCEEAAAQVAGVMTVLRGPGAPFTTAAECKALSAADMADFHEVLHTRCRNGRVRVRVNVRVRVRARV